MMITLLDCSNGSLLLHDANIHHRVTKLRTTGRCRRSSMDTSITVRRQQLIQSLLTLLSKLRTFMSVQHRNDDRTVAATSPEGDTPADIQLLEI
jgi:hypothetical protein